MIEYLCFIDKIGVDNDGKFVYRFDFTTDKDTIWGEYFNVTPASIIPQLEPDASQLSHRGKVALEYDLNLAKTNNCYSMQDCIDGIIPLAFASLEIEDFPQIDDKPLVFRFGEEYDEVKEKLEKLDTDFFEYEGSANAGDESIIDDFINGPKEETVEEIQERVEMDEFLDQYENDENFDFEEKEEYSENNFNEDGKLVFIKHFYDEPDGTYIYQFFFSTTPDDVWGQYWDVFPPNVNGDMTPDETTYESVYEIHSNYKFKTLEETSCFSMEYGVYDLLALGWIDIEGLDEYPEYGRSVFHYGDSFVSVKIKVETYSGWIEKKDGE